MRLLRRLPNSGSAPAATDAPSDGRSAAIGLLQAGRFQLPLDRPLLMGVVNVTPDSFSDAGRFVSPAQSIDHALALIDEGADLLDIGGESTRPGAPTVPAQQEIDRIAPVLAALAGHGVPLSVDTRKPEVMRYAVAEGADMINDVAGFGSPEAVAAVAASPAALCVMHMQGDPATMQAQPRYVDVVTEVVEFLRARQQNLEAHGVAAQRIVLDPGIGFGKTQAQNQALIRHLDRLLEVGSPVLIGLSRKSLIGHLTGRDVADRLVGSVAGALAAVASGAAIVRVHDVGATRDALKVWQGLTQDD